MPNLTKSLKVSASQIKKTNFCTTYFGAKIYKLPLPKDLDDHTVMGFDPQYGFFQVMSDV